MAIIRDPKEEARKHPFDSAGEIIDRILNEKYRKILPHQGIDPKNLARAINREREQQLPRIDLADIKYPGNRPELGRPWPGSFLTGAGNW